MESLPGGEDIIIEPAKVEKVCSVCGSKIEGSFCSKCKEVLSQQTDFFA